MTKMTKLEKAIKKKAEAEDLAKRVIRYRSARNMPMTELAKQIGVCWQTIFNLEHNEYMPQRTTVAKIEMFLEKEENLDTQNRQ